MTSGQVSYLIGLTQSSVSDFVGLPFLWIELSELDFQKYNNFIDYGMLCLLTPSLLWRAPHPVPGKL